MTLASSVTPDAIHPAVFVPLAIVLWWFLLRPIVAPMLRRSFWDGGPEMNARLGAVDQELSHSD